MTTNVRVSDVKTELESASSSAKTVEAFMAHVVQILHDRMLKYNWVGFYMIEEIVGAPPILVLGAFQGAMTPHTRIPLHQGICGAAASSGRTVVVDDVASDPRYLACSIETKSEIVVPVFVRDKVVGELDIDSHFPAAFGAEDRELVEFAAVLVGKHLEKTRS